MALAAGLILGGGCAMSWVQSFNEFVPVPLASKRDAQRARPIWVRLRAGASQRGEAERARTF